MSAADPWGHMLAALAVLPTPIKPARPAPAPRDPKPRVKRKPLRAADILAPRTGTPAFGPLSNRSLKK